MAITWSKVTAGSTDTISLSTEESDAKVALVGSVDVSGTSVTKKLIYMDESGNVLLPYNIGDTSTPIYINNGVPTACTSITGGDSFLFTTVTSW